MNLQNTGEFELPLGYATINGDLFKSSRRAGLICDRRRVSRERMTRNRDSLNQTFQSIGSMDGQGSRVNRDVWSIYEEVRVPFTEPVHGTSPASTASRLTLPNARSGTARTLLQSLTPLSAGDSSQYNAQKPKVSIRWQPLDPKYIGALTLRGSYTEAFHAPTADRDFRQRVSRPFHWSSIQRGLHQIRRLRNALPETHFCIRKWLMNGLTERFTARSGSRASHSARIGGTLICATSW